MMNYARQLLTQDASIDNITLAEGWGPSSDLPLCVLLRNWKPLQAFDWEPLHSHSWRPTVQTGRAGRIAGGLQEKPFQGFLSHPSEELRFCHSSTITVWFSRYNDLSDLSWSQQNSPIDQCDTSWRVPQLWSELRWELSCGGARHCWRSTLALQMLDPNIPHILYHSMIFYACSWFANKIHLPRKEIHLPTSCRQFQGNVPLGRYLHHTATFASLNMTKKVCYFVSPAADREKKESLLAINTYI